MDGDVNGMSYFAITTVVAFFHCHGFTEQLGLMWFRTVSELEVSEWG